MPLKEDLDQIRNLASAEHYRDACREINRVAHDYPISRMNEIDQKNFVDVVFEPLFKVLCKYASGILHKDHPEVQDAAILALEVMFNPSKSTTTYDEVNGRTFCAEAIGCVKYIVYNIIKKNVQMKEKHDKYGVETNVGFMQNKNFVSDQAHGESFSEFAKEEKQVAWLEKCILKTVFRFPNIGAKGMIYLYVYGLSCFRGEINSYTETAEYHGWPHNKLDSYKHWLYRNPKVIAYFKKCLGDGM